MSSASAAEASASPDGDGGRGRSQVQARRRARRQRQREKKKRLNAEERRVAGGASGVAAIAELEAALGGLSPQAEAVALRASHLFLPLQPPPAPPVRSRSTSPLPPSNVRSPGGTPAAAKRGGGVNGSSFLDLPDLALPLTIGSGGGEGDGSEANEVQPRSLVDLSIGQLDTLEALLHARLRDVEAARTALFLHQSREKEHMERQLEAELQTFSLG